MENLRELLAEVSKLSVSIDKILRASEFYQYDDLSGLDMDLDNPDEIFLHEELRNVLAQLDKAKCAVEYLESPIMGEYVLHKNGSGRYECEVHEFTSGNTIECLVFDDFDERFKWVATRVEHNGEDYYLVGYKNMSMDGLKIRIRK